MGRRSPFVPESPRHNFEEQSYVLEIFRRQSAVCYRAWYSGTWLAIETVDLVTHWPGLATPNDVSE